MADSRLDTMGRKLIDLREDYNALKRKADNAYEDLKSHERDMWDYMKAHNTKTTTLELGEGYGDVAVGRRETKTGYVFDIDAALESFDNEARSDEMIEPKVRKKVLNDLVRTRIENGQPLPAGVELHVTPYIQMSRKKTKTT